MRDHRGGGAAGRVAYVFYRALSHAVSPLLHLHIRCWRRLRGLEHPDRWPERLGRPSSPRPPGPLLWFHAVSLGEGLAVVPLIRHCLQQQQQQQQQQHPSFVLLMTTTTTSAFEVIKDQLPIGVIYQFAPLDTPVAVGAFLKYWNPTAIFLMESELWPNLILSAAENGIAVALLNARMSAKSFKLWSGPVARHLISLMLSKFCLIASLSTVEAVRFQLLHAQPFIINFPGDLKYAVGDSDVAEKQAKKAEELHLQLANRPVWMASSIHSGEEEVVLWVHKELIDMYPDMITIIVPRHPQHGKEIARALSRQGLKVMLRSRSETISSSTSFYVVDTLGELKALYWITPIAVIGGSFLPGLAGHNMSEAAAASCAVLIGPHVGHFSYMVSEMLRSDSLSVWQTFQVSGKVELVEALRSLLGDSKALEARQRAAKLAFSAVSEGVVRRVWDLIDAHVLKKVFQAG